MEIIFVRALLIFLIVLCSLLQAFAQSANSDLGNSSSLPSQATNTDEFKKLEVFAGFSHSRSNFGLNRRDNRLNNPNLRGRFGKREGFNGFNGSITYNISQYLGFKTDFSIYFNKRNASLNNVKFNVKEKLVMALVGLQIKNNSNESSNRLKGFAHLLVGVARTSTNTNRNVCGQAFGSTCPVLLNKGQTGFAAAVGGGLDLHITNRFGFRLVQVDYTPIRIAGKTLSGFRLSSGIVF